MEDIHLYAHFSTCIISPSSNTDITLRSVNQHSSLRIAPFQTNAVFRLYNFHLQLPLCTVGLAPLITPFPTSFDRTKQQFPCSIAFLNSRIHNIRMLENCMPFLTSASTTVCQSFFCNCTLERTPTLKQPYYSENCLLDSSIISDGEEGIYGELLTGAAKQTLSSFICINCTFHRCVHTPSSHSVITNTDYYDRSFTNRQSLSSSSSHSFTNCTFTNCSTSEYGGGLYYSSSSSYTLTITSCTVTNCTSTSSAGGGIYVNSSGLFVITSSTFTACSASTSGGGIYVNNIKICTCVRDCVFESCTASSYGGGADLFSSNSTSSTCEGGVSEGMLNGCTFTSCSANYGGGIYLCQNSELTIRECSFISCSSRYGGAVYWLISDTQEDRSGEWLYGCSFIQNTANVSGSAIQINSSLSGHANIFDSECYAITSNSSNLVSLDGTSKSGWLKVIDARFVSPSALGSDSTCTSSTKTSCISLYSAYNTFDSSTTYRVINLLEGNHTNEKVTLNVSSFNLSITGISSPTLTLTSSFTSSTSVFTLSTGMISLNQFSVSLHTDCSLVSISSTGCITLNTITLYSDSPSLALTNPLITIESCSLNFTSSVFENITRSSGNGSIIYVSHSSTPSLYISDTNFTNCSTKNGNGGGLYVDMNGGTLSCDRVRFDGCSAEYGGGIYLSLFSTNTPSISFTHITLTSSSFSSMSDITHGILLFLHTNNTSLLYQDSFLPFLSCSSIHSAYIQVNSSLQS